VPADTTPGRVHILSAFMSQDIFELVEPQEAEQTVTISSALPADATTGRTRDRRTKGVDDQRSANPLPGTKASEPPLDDAEARNIRSFSVLEVKTLEPKVGAVTARKMLLHALRVAEHTLLAQLELLTPSVFVDQTVKSETVTRDKTAGHRKRKARPSPPPAPAFVPLTPGGVRNFVDENASPSSEGDGLSDESDD